MLEITGKAKKERKPRKTAKDEMPEKAEKPVKEKKEKPAKKETTARRPGRPRCYEAEAFYEAAHKFYDSITFDDPVFRMVETGEYTQKGKPVYKKEPVMVEKNGEKVQAVKTGFILPPTVQRLCLALGISLDTFESYATKEEYADTCRWWKLVCEAYSAELLQTKEGNVQGIMFTLKNAYGWSDKTEVQVSGGIEAYLAKLETENGGKSGQVL